MTTIVTRAGKGSPLTHTEVDTNFTNLNTAKLETAAIPLGTLQAPSVSFLNDSDTGIFCPQGGNSLAIVTGGQYAITCSSTQAVGIKTANPQGALQVAGSTRIGANDATDAFLEIGEGATGNRNSYIDIVADTTYTDYGLRVIRNNTGANATSELKHRGTGALNFTTQEAAPIVFNTTNSPALTITSGGLVGIGNSSPRGIIHVGADLHNGATDAAAINLKQTSTTAATGIYLERSAERKGYYIYLGGSEDSLNFQRNSSGTKSDVMTLTRDGLVGIGTTSPNSVLQVNSGTNLGGILIGFSAGSSNFYDADLQVFRTGNGTERARIDSSGRMLVGTTTARDNFFNAASGNAWQFQVEGTDYKNSCASFTSNTTSTGDGPHLILARSRGPAVGSNAIVSSASGGDSLGLISFQGADGSKFVQGAKIEALVDGTPGAADMPGRLVFSTTADGASSPTERMRITNAGFLKASNTGSYQGTTGTYHEFINSLNNTVLFVKATNASYSDTILFLDTDRSANSTYNSIYVRANGTGQFSVRGDGVIFAQNTTVQSISDARVKENVQDSNEGLNVIKQLRPVRFDFKEGFGNNRKNQLGFIAQEVETVFPDAVDVSGETDETHEPYKTVGPASFIPVLVKALQEAIGRIETLEAEVAALKAQ